MVVRFKSTDAISAYHDFVVSLIPACRRFTIFFVTEFQMLKWSEIKTTIKPAFKGHSRESKNVPFKSSCPLYTG